MGRVACKAPEQMAGMYGELPGTGQGTCATLPVMGGNLPATAPAPTRTLSSYSHCEATTISSPSPVALHRLAATRDAKRSSGRVI